MFWKSNKTNRPKGINNLDPIFIAPPMNKYFKTAHQILKNAMVFNDNGEYDICNETLHVLKKHIDKYCSEGDVKIDKPNPTVNRGNTTPPPSPKKNEKPWYIEKRDIMSAKLDHKEVKFTSNIGVFDNKYPGIISNCYVKEEILKFNTPEDAEKYFYLETQSIRNEREVPKPEFPKDRPNTTSTNNI